MWGEAVKAACHTKNCCPVNSNNFCTPNERWSGRTPGVKHLKPFGCKVFVAIPKQHRDKLDPRSEEGYLVGYENFTKGYRVWIPSKGHKICVSRDVKFEENIFYTNRLSPKQEERSYDDIVYLHTSSGLTPRLVGEDNVQQPQNVEPRVGGVVDNMLQEDVVEDVVHAEPDQEDEEVQNGGEVNDQILDEQVAQQAERMTLRNR